MAEEGNTDNQRAEMATNHPVSFMEVWICEVGGWCVLKGVGWVEGLGGWGLSVFRGNWWVDGMGGLRGWLGLMGWVG